ncbi:LysR substrate-binding domain-containing protein [Massilia cavernae]|uniref:LysR family transcriptional regulator n=1 Tax=Massilia cavernae TaxID=2320864 RepID=A0A418Y6E2_9BURK|nr:LysR substrate-binding domain-containing protein [Massilia cavernae]RJG23440.1 LysR family transcriptional regulator [Massilia cavernae]
MIEPREMDLNLLVVFQEVFQQRQISSAARRLDLTQSAVSNALARLRRTFNDELFVRTASGMQPTPFAENIAEPIAAALASVTLALNRPESFDPFASERQFTIAVTDVAEIYFLPPLIERCQVVAPRIRLATVRPGSVDLKAEMEAGRIDVAIGAFDKVSTALYQRRLFRQPYVTMFRAGHPLGEGVPALKVFLAAQHILVASTESPYDRINQVLEKAGVREESRYRVPHFTAVPYIVSSTDLVVTVPQKLAERAAAPFNLAYIRPPLRLPLLQTNIFWHRRYNDDEGNQWLRGLVGAIFVE